jgi:hypothetical protein
MRLFLIFLIAGAAEASTFTDILTAQGTALERIAATPPKAGLKLTELITDIGVTKKGVLGLSAQSARKALEIRWRRKASVPSGGDDSAEFELEGDLPPAQIESLATSIADLANKSGKLRVPAQAGKVLAVLEDLRTRMAQFSVTRVGGWKLRGLRLDLNFTASGEVSLFTKAGAAIRFRLDWDFVDRPLVPGLVQNDGTKFVTKVLSALDAASSRIQIPGFEPKQVSLGVGASVRRNFFGLWKYSAGFIGYLVFVPAPPAKVLQVALPVEFAARDLEIGGLETDAPEALSEKTLWRRRNFVRFDFRNEMIRGLETVSTYAGEVRRLEFAHWYVSEVKTISDVSRAGLLRLADVTTRGVIEIDYRRVNP